MVTEPCTSSASEVGVVVQQSKRWWMGDQEWAKEGSEVKGGNCFKEWFSSVFEDVDEGEEMVLTECGLGCVRFQSPFPHRVGA